MVDKNQFDENGDPHISNVGRFSGDTDSVEPLGVVRGEHSDLTAAQRRDNEEHDRIMAEAREAPEGTADDADERLAEDIGG
jgi:hypothetical protein